MKTSQASFKRVIVTALVAVFAAIALAGCGGGQASSKASSDSASSSSASSSSSAASIETLSSSAATPSSSSASASSASASSTSTPSASSSSPTSGTEIDYLNEKEGYMFKVDSSYVTETDGSNVYVYTGKEGQVPFFSLYLMKNSSGQSVEDILNASGQDTVNKYGDKIVKGPVANKVETSNRTIKGYEYVLEENGSQTAYYIYAEDIDGTFYLWTGVAPVTDAATPSAMDCAMKTLQFRTA